jgi:hypothetical protein
MKKYLQHRKPAFHGPLINLITANMLMKQKSSHHAAKHEGRVESHGRKYGEMTSDELAAIQRLGRVLSSLFDSFLPQPSIPEIIEAIVPLLPHTNEASAEVNKNIIFFLMLLITLHFPDNNARRPPQFSYCCVRDSLLKMIETRSLPLTQEEILAGFQNQTNSSK